MNVLNIRKIRGESSASPSVSNAEKLRSIAYSMDILAPGFYIWFGDFSYRIGGCIPDDQPYRYPGTIHNRFGVALVLPGYRIFTTYQGTHDPDQTPT